MTFLESGRFGFEILASLRLSKVDTSNHEAYVANDSTKVGIAASLTHLFVVYGEYLMH
jgi:hypothetical protein